jgi:hypothetical protein
LENASNTPQAGLQKAPAFFAVRLGREWIWLGDSFFNWRKRACFCDLMQILQIRLNLIFFGLTAYFDTAQRFYLWAFKASVNMRLNCNVHF